MRLVEKLNLALKQCEYPSLLTPTSFLKIGNGAWHEAYLVTLQDQSQWVIRLRKEIIYGQREPFDENNLREDYEPVKLYYQQANQCRKGICPELYEYRLQPGLNFTLETYMGPTLTVSRLTPEQLFNYGEEVGRLFRKIHALPPPVVGFGELMWDGVALKGEDTRSTTEIWIEEIISYHQMLRQLASSEFSFNQRRIQNKLDWVLTDRSFAAEPIVFVNGDITPENFIAADTHFTGLVDPVPRLDNGTRYASFFLFCYRFFLPVLADTTRYRHHQFQQKQPQLNAIADGFLAGYAQYNEYDLRYQIHLEYFLHLLELAYRCFLDLQGDLSMEAYLRRGTKTAISARLRHCLETLETISLDWEEEKN